jgi:hypothetical protein
VLQPVAGIAAERVHDLPPPQFGGKGELDQ